MSSAATATPRRLKDLIQGYTAQLKINSEAISKTSYVGICLQILADLPKLGIPGLVNPEFDIKTVLHKKQTANASYLTTAELSLRESVDYTAIHWEVVVTCLTITYYACNKDDELGKFFVDNFISGINTIDPSTELKPQPYGVRSLEEKLSQQIHDYFRNIRRWQHYQKLVHILNETQRDWFNVNAIEESILCSRFETHRVLGTPSYETLQQEINSICDAQRQSFLEKAHRKVKPQLKKIHFAFQLLKNLSEYPYKLIDPTALTIFKELLPDSFTLTKAELSTFQKSEGNITEMLSDICKLIEAAIDTNNPVFKQTLADLKNLSLEQAQEKQNSIDNGLKLTIASLFKQALVMNLDQMLPIICHAADFLGDLKPILDKLAITKSRPIVTIPEHSSALTDSSTREPHRSRDRRKTGADTNTGGAGGGAGAGSGAGVNVARHNAMMNLEWVDHHNDRIDVELHELELTTTKYTFERTRRSAGSDAKAADMLTSLNWGSHHKTPYTPDKASVRGRSSSMSSLQTTPEGRRLAGRVSPIITPGRERPASGFALRHPATAGDILKVDGGKPLRRSQSEQTLSRFATPTYNATKVRVSPAKRNELRRTTTPPT